MPRGMRRNTGDIKERIRRTVREVFCAILLLAGTAYCLYLNGFGESLREAGIYVPWQQAGESSAGAGGEKTENRSDEGSVSDTAEQIEKSEQEKTEISDTSEESITLDEIPAYTGSAYTIMHENVPFFTERDKETISGVVFEKQDSLGRCHAAAALLDKETMPSEERTVIPSDIQPSGWQTQKYEELIEGSYLYNRCHLIGYRLCGDEGTDKNLITGTRYLNVIGMLPFESLTAAYIRKSGNHVLYRVTPLYKENDLVAAGVLMEALSLEDDGETLSFCVFCYNVQPGVSIRYATGMSEEDPASHIGAHDSCAVNRGTFPVEKYAAHYELPTENKEGSNEQGTQEQGDQEQESKGKEQSEQEAADYIVNIHSGKFHRPDCENAASMKEKNRKDVTERRSKLIEEGYKPCGYCKP